MLSPDLPPSQKSWLQGGVQHGVVQEPTEVEEGGGPGPHPGHGGGASQQFVPPPETKDGLWPGREVAKTKGVLRAPKTSQPGAYFD